MVTTRRLHAMRLCAAWDLCAAVGIRAVSACGWWSVLPEEVRTGLVRAGVSHVDDPSPESMTRTAAQIRSRSTVRGRGRRRDGTPSDGWP